MGMIRPQVVVVGERVCVGGGVPHSGDDFHLVFQYDPARDEWTVLPPGPAYYFGLGQLSGELLTVGGVDRRKGIIKKVYHYKPESQRWEEFLQPMPTARAGLTVISTQSALIACGGATDITSDGKYMPCSIVEVFTTETSQWHTTDPLPVPCKYMSSATINDTGYLLGGVTTDNNPTVLYAPVASLIHRATSHPQQPTSVARPDSTSSAWKTLRDTPLRTSAAASLGGMLLALGGEYGEVKIAVHVYSPATSTWIRVESGDLPERRFFCTAVELSANRLLVVGGCDQDGKDTNTVFLGSFIIGV